MFIKREYFAEIVARRKQIEYRTLSEYWLRRLEKVEPAPFNLHLFNSMARPSMDYVDDGNLILFPEATHWVQRDAAEEVNHYLMDLLLDKISQQVML